MDYYSERELSLFRVFLFSALCTMFVAPVVAGVGSVDSREYVDWRKYPEIVHLMMHNDDGGRYLNDKSTIVGAVQCTGQYVAPNLILTASHCIKDASGKVKQGNNYAIRPGPTYSAPDKQGQYTTETDFETFKITLLYSPDDYCKAKTVGDDCFLHDWAVFKVDEPSYYADKYYDLQQIDKNKEVRVFNAGFGTLRVLTAEHIGALRQVYNDWIKNENNGTQDLNQEFNSVLSPLSLDDDFDNHLLKLDLDCKVKHSQSGCVDGNCDVWAGNSGGAIVSQDNNKLIAVLKGGDASGSSYEFADDSQLMYGVESSVFNKKLQELIRQNPPEESGSASQAQTSGETKTEVAVGNTNNSSTETLAKIPGLGVNNILGSMTSPQAPTLITNLNTNNDGDFSAKAQEIWAAADKQIAAVSDKKGNNLTDKEFVHLIVEPVATASAKVKQLERAYQRAKENEQSLANRTLSSLTMAATGIGGMELARGLAEQKADKAAQDEMNAYISGFQCKIGGKSYSGGTNGIEAPGANQLIKLYQEYVDLAASLKERKAALGLKPGIESDVVLDKAATGMYDEVGHGIENGTYASLYRAVKGNATDAQKLQEQQDASKKRVIGGAVAAGAGVVGGIIGNIAINGKDGKGRNNDDDTGTNGLADGEYDNEISVANGDGDTVPQQQGEDLSAEMVSTTNSAASGASTTGCGFGQGIITSTGGCSAKYSGGSDLTRCTNCVKNAGTYENGICYIEVIGWACLGKGWNVQVKTPNPAPCSNAADRYNDCHIIRKYVDVEKPFTCDPAKLIGGGKSLISGCGQHGWSAGDKHPPMNIGGTKFKAQDCQLPLSSNTGWRKAYSKGSAIGINYNGKSVTTTNWCMPSPNSSPWNSKNHTGSATHLKPSSLMAGGESKDKWFSLD